MMGKNTLQSLTALKLILDPSYNHMTNIFRFLHIRSFTKLIEVIFRDTLVDTTLPYVSFGDTVASTRPLQSVTKYLNGPLLRFGREASKKALVYKRSRDKQNNKRESKIKRNFAHFVISVIRCQFHERFMCSFYARRFRKHKKILLSHLYLLRFWGLCE